MKTQSCGLGPADSRVSQMFAGPVCLGWTDQSGMWGGEEMVDISENLACSGLLAIFPIWGCSSFQKSWQELMVCPESRIWSRSKLCEEQLSCSPSQARGRLQPVQTMTPRPWPWLSLSCPTQDAPADRWFTGQGVLGQGEQGWSSLPGGKSSALTEGTAMSPPPAKACRAVTAEGCGALCQAGWVSPDSRVSSPLRVSLCSWGRAGYPAQTDCSCGCRVISSLE